MGIDRNWFEEGAVVPVDIETTEALLKHCKELQDLIKSHIVAHEKFVSFTEGLLDTSTKLIVRQKELLERCENEMRYAGWTEYESDNPQRHGLYEQIVEHLR